MILAFLANFIINFAFKIYGTLKMLILDAQDNFRFEPPLLGFLIVGGHPPNPVNFFETLPSHIKLIPPHGASPHLKMKSSHLKNKPLPPLKREAPYHEMIPRKSTINNDLKSGCNPSKICVNKFIFSKFAGLLAYSQQLYYQVNSFTGIL